MFPFNKKFSYNLVNKFNISQKNIIGLLPLPVVFSASSDILFDHMTRMMLKKCLNWNMIVSIVGGDLKHFKYLIRWNRIKLHVFITQFVFHFHPQHSVSEVHAEHWICLPPSLYAFDFGKRSDLSKVVGHMRVRLLGPEILHFGTSAKQKKKFQKGTLLSSGEMSGALAPPSVYFCTLLIKK